MSNQPLDETTKSVILGLAIFFAGLIGLVVIIGLFKGQLDPVAIATILSGLFTGLMSGFGLLMLRSGRNGDTNVTPNPQETSDEK